MAEKVTKFQQAAEQLKQIEDENVKKLLAEQRTQEDWAKEVIAWQERYNEVAMVNNRYVEIINGMMQFITMQCGILYTAITGETKVEDPLQEISKINNVQWDATQEDLDFFRTGLIIYLKKLKENGNVEEAMQTWNEYILK